MQRQCATPNLMIGQEVSNGDNDFFESCCFVLMLSFYLGKKTKSVSGYFAAGGQIHWAVNGIVKNRLIYRKNQYIMVVNTMRKI